MPKRSPVILIGPTCDDPAESVSAVNLALVEGLQDRFTFVCSACNRRYGLTRQSRLNLWNLYYLLKHLLIWLKNIIQYRPDIAHYAISSDWAMKKGFLMLGLARLFRIQTVGHLHCGGFVDHWQQMGPWQRRFASMQLARLNAFVILSEQWRMLMITQIGMDPAKLHVVNNPISSEFEQLAMKIAVRRNVVRLLSLGTMGRDKGVFELVDACAKVAEVCPGLSLDIVGPEREPGVRNQVARRIGDLDLDRHIRLVGSVHGSAKLDLFKESSIFVLPSHYENFPLVVLEAAAAGHAIITTPVGAVPEFFRHGISALFVDIGDSRSLAEAITLLLQNPEERNRLAMSARETFRERLSRAGIMNSMEKVYKHVLGRPHQV